MTVLVGTPLDDTLTGDDGTDNTIDGQGGDDRLVGGKGGSNELFGDSSTEFSGSNSENGFPRGGNDTLIGGDDATNTLVGDADTLKADGDENFGAEGGDDLLISGTGADDMWGDAKHIINPGIPSIFSGRDVFRFLADNGNDTIHDFELGKDRIDVSAIVLSVVNARAGILEGQSGSLPPLKIEVRDVDNDGKPDSVIHFDANNSVTVLGVTGLLPGDFIGIESSSYVLFSRTSTGGGHRDDWVGSEANSHPGTTPGSNVPASAFDADRATGPDTALAGPGAADYAADGVLASANIAMFNLTETSPGLFASDAPADLSSRIAAHARFFGTADTDLDPAHSEIDLAAGKLHLAQTDRDWNGIKNLEISLDTGTSFRDIRLEDFVDVRLRIGDGQVNLDEPFGGTFDVQVFGAKRGEVDASRAPQAMDLHLSVWTNSGTSQNSSDIKGSIFGDSVEIRPGDVTGSRFGESESWYQRSEDPRGIFYVGEFTTVSANLGAGDDQFDSLAEFRTAEGFLITENGQFRTTDHVWGGTGGDIIHGGYGDDRLFGDNGSGAWTNPDPISPTVPVSAPQGPPSSNDVLLDGGPGADWLEGNQGGGVDMTPVNGNDPFGDVAFVEIGFAGTERIDCGLAPPIKGPRNTDGAPDVVNLNAFDGIDVVDNFEPGIDTVRIADVGMLSQQVVPSNEGEGLLIKVQSQPISIVGVFLVGITAPLGQSVDGDFLLLS